MSKRNLSMLPKQQKIQLCISVILVLGTLIYTYFNFPPMGAILKDLGAEAELPAGIVLFLKYFWLLTLLPSLLLLVIFVFHRNPKTLGQVMLLFALCSCALMVAVTLYLQSTLVIDASTFPAGVVQLEVQK